jgi:hypothetical protein
LPHGLLGYAAMAAGIDNIRKRIQALFPLISLTSVSLDTGLAEIHVLGPKCKTDGSHGLSLLNQLADKKRLFPKGFVFIWLEIGRNADIGTQADTLVLMGNGMERLLWSP